MAVAVADLSRRVGNPVTTPSTKIGVLIVCECPLFRVGLRVFLAHQDDCDIVGEATFLENVLLLAKLHRVSRGECLVTGDVLAAQAARRERLARLRRDALLAASLAEVPLRAQQGGNGKSPAPEDDDLLSPRERAVLELIARGWTNAQVAQALGISPHTVKNHLNEIYRKLQVSNRTSAVVKAIRERWLAIDGIYSVSL